MWFPAALGSSWLLPCCLLLCPVAFAAFLLRLIHPCCSSQLAAGCGACCCQLASVWGCGLLLAVLFAAPLLSSTAPTVLFCGLAAFVAVYCSSAPCCCASVVLLMLSRACGCALPLLPRCWFLLLAVAMRCSSAACTAVLLHVCIASTYFGAWGHCLMVCCAPAARCRSSVGRFLPAPCLLL